MAFSPDGETLASGNADNSVRLRSVGTGQLERTLIGHKGEVRRVAFSPDGWSLASYSVDKTIRLWDLETGELKRTLTGVYVTVWSVSFSPNGELLASGAEDARPSAYGMWIRANVGMP